MPSKSISVSRTFLLTGMVVILGGCATTGEQGPPPVATNIPIESDISEHWVPVVRHGRYTLAELKPELSQRDLSQQVVEVAMPAQPSATVEGGMQYLLLRTGYSLCHTDETLPLYALPLPAAHLRLGPQTLRDALQTLAGPGWRMVLDQASRQVCFVRLREAVDSTTAGASP